ncbi:uncharacterized protein BP5553_01873 [Venustampulla echinocandica]|uniref:Thioredoxin-like protein n=1 Tax=Venustampulla echinocandica TaxID=2656787 RepID=A0A370U288_9HELO|nr:uncharacterized protein BP5553_01873 [Venustampulla echinocandica]RDL41894.1 hypothetical protein BP5553_01873 [Venustampulla echinocandica]
MARLAFKALHLYTSPLSGCSARIRITALLKDIPLTYHEISISSSQQSSHSYLAINPNASVPSFVIELPENASSPASNITITQSPAIIDFLESHFPNPPLIPSPDMVRERARVMELASLVACDIQPPQNSRIRKKIAEEFDGNGEAWARYVYERGFGVYEKFLEETGNEKLGEVIGKGPMFSLGSKVTLADVFLVPAAQGASRVGVGLERWPLLKSVTEECLRLNAFRLGGVGQHKI